MNPSPNLNPCEQSEVTCAYVAQALAPSEVAAAEAHIASLDLPRFRGGLRAWDQGIWSEGFLAAKFKVEFQ